MYKILNSQNQLFEFVERALNVSAIALDTEFFWERSYHPILGLIQVALAGDECSYLIDVQEIKDLSPLGLLLVAPRITKVLHDCPQDLFILRRATTCRAPRSIFDTRIAAGFAGFSSKASLASNLEHFLDISLSKTETRTDWLKRPLSSKQLEYASDDVAHLLALKSRIEAVIEANGNQKYVSEELKLFENDAISSMRDPAQAFLRIKGRGRLNSKQLARLAGLAHWRERAAEYYDKPRKHIVEDSTLLNLARIGPLDIGALSKVKGLSKEEKRKYGKRMLEVMRYALEQPEKDWPKPKEKNIPARESASDRAEQLSQAIAQIAESEGIDTALFATSSEIKALTKAVEVESEDYSLLQGWRRELLTPILQKLDLI